MGLLNTPKLNQPAAAAAAFVQTSKASWPHLFWRLTPSSHQKQEVPEKKCIGFTGEGLGQGLGLSRGRGLGLNVGQGRRAGYSFASPMCLFWEGWGCFGDIWGSGKVLGVLGSGAGWGGITHKINPPHPHCPSRTPQPETQGFQGSQASLKHGVLRLTPSSHQKQEVPENKCLGFTGEGLARGLGLSK